MREELIFLAGLKPGSELKDRETGDLVYILELPEKGEREWHVTGDADRCMCESWFDGAELFERFEATGKTLPIHEIEQADRTCSCENRPPFVFEGKGKDGKPAMHCPMCSSVLPWTELKEGEESTHLYICPECPFVGFEYLSKVDTERVAKHLESRS